MNIEEEIQALKARNNRVEAEKAWEISHFRKLAICTVTYITVGIVMAIIGIPEPHINALIPTLGYYLSTLGLGFVKAAWIQKIYKSKE